MSGAAHAPQEDVDPTTGSPITHERTPLIPERETTSYGSRHEEATPRTHARMTSLDQHSGIVKTYDVGRLASFRVFYTWTGTVFEDTGLWTETLGLFAVYIIIFAVVYHLRWDGFKDFVGKEENIRAFIVMLSTLIGLLLSFYTALNLNRWWNMRLAVHDVESASAKLIMLLSQTVTSDKEALMAVQRYTRCSLFMVFAASGGCGKAAQDHPRNAAVVRGLITEDEAEQLRKLNPHMTFVQAQTLWVWIAHLITRMHEQGMTKGPPHYVSLINAAEHGRDGIASIETFLTTMVPFGYVHLLCLMVKLHNFILAGLMALVGVLVLGDHHKPGDSFEAVPLFRTMFRAVFMPFLYNSILILNTAVTDPFGADACDFDFRVFDIGMEHSAQAFMAAQYHLPKWMSSSRKYDPLGAPV